ncbi:glycogen debranching enzyme, partial [Asbolus verrucosus]
ITGARGEEKDQENKDLSDKSKTKSKKSRHKVKKSPTREPSFSTTLTSPIEEVIEETLNEEVRNGESVESKPSNKPKKRNKSTKNKPKSTEHIEDDVGFSFFKAKSVDSAIKQESTVNSKAKLEKSEPQISPEDPLGFSFLPVKRSPKKSKRPKIDDLPKSSLIEHFQPTRNKKIATDSETKEFVKVAKTEELKPDEQGKEKSQDNLIEIVNKSIGKVVYLETKESQKVHSKISYASVTSHRFKESLEQLHKEEELSNKRATSFDSVETAPLKQEQIEKSEELVSEIESEELVDVIEETQNKIDDESSSVEDKIETPSEIKTVDSGNLSLDEEFVVDNITVEKTLINVNEHCQNVIDVEEQFSTNVPNSEVTLRKESEEIVDTKIEIISKPFKMSSGIQVRVLTLNDKEHQDSVLYRIEKNWILQFRLGPSLLGRKVSLYCNYPKKNQEYDRNLYHLLEWSQDEGCNYSDDTALLTEITPKISGSFHYYFTYENGDQREPQGSGFILVDPVLKYGNNEELPLDCIQCQTVLAKSLGPFDTWESKLKVAKESGYNMIHFTPIQELGVSNSSYSLSEQLKVNPIFTKQNGEKTTFEDIENLVVKLRSEWKVVSICDIVLNHTANESEWLQEHPEVTYNCLNCPYMRPSYLLDAALHQFSLDVTKGLYEDKGIPIQVNTEEHLSSIRYYLHTEVLANINIHELYMCDVSKYLVEFLSLARNKVPSTQEKLNENEELELIQDPLYRRLGSTIDMKLAVQLYNIYRHDCFDEETRIKRCAEDFKSKLESLNNKVIDSVNEHLNVAVENVITGIRYFRIQQDGPKIKEVSAKNPLSLRYFTDYGTPSTLKEHEEIMYGENGKFLMAHNGWVMNSDPLQNFAAPRSNVYIRRELISWGDSVKLRFGEKPEDCPFLWNHMKTYVEQTARIFDGVRLDNCHSTPIPVAEYLLDCARKVRPDLYVVAELFTNSDMTDNIFVNRLGITSLIREAMSAWNSHEQGRLVYRYGGSPVGSFYQPRVRPLVPSIAHALFLDLTHDNPSPVEKRSVFDLLPSTALVNMACCASGSNRGYDELVPHHIHVVDETRQYTEWAENDNLAIGNLRYVTNKSGIIAAKKALNDLHFHLGAEGFNQVYVDQMDSDIVAVTRHCPETHQSYVLVAFTAFSHPSEDAADHQRGIKPLRVEGVLDEIVFEASLSHISVKSPTSKYTKFQNFHKDNHWINGLFEYQVQLKQHIQPEDSEIFEKVDSGTANVVQLNFKNFKPGSVAVIKVSLPEDMREAIKNVRNLISQFSVKKETELWKIVTDMTLPDLNRVLYRCDQEERDEGHGFDTYNIPNFDRLVYAGLQGFMSLMCNIRPNNDLGHPMCANLRDGNWMIDYIWQRLKLDESTKRLGQWFEENTKSLKQIPRYLIPCYFDVIVTGIYILLIEQSHNLMSDFVKKGSTFVRSLAMGSLQFAAYVKSADLPTLSPNLSEPKPPQRKNENGENVQACVTLSAGLPHFSVGYMRNWGRDTFIALRGLLLLTGRYQDARYHILGYGACLRHGLIPNLLDGGRNSRDAVWWWLYCIKCYVEDAPDGIRILSDKVSRIFPTDDSPAQPAGSVDQSLHEVIQEALTVHFQGLVFRERNAGRQIDEHMSDNGFNNQIGIHPETGFVFGGNAFNCGTWMDKMGSSDKARNRGKPATPRDGSAIELIGLSKSVVSWLDKLSKDGVYPYDGVKRTHKNGNMTRWTFKEWADKIQNNFEKYFWINTTSEPNEIRPDLINKRGIYKDCYGASQEWTDFQLRCNFPVAMVVAPELFNPQHAWVALQKAEKYLLGPLGMKTLDPEDWAYNGNYDNSNDSDNHNIAHGFNYHQGPEWVWPLGFYLRAKLRFAAANGELQKTVATTKVVLSKHFIELQTSAWRGLPELTNQNGEYCNDSSRTQAWKIIHMIEDNSNCQVQPFQKNFTVYSDLYFKNNITLNKSLLKLSAYVHGSNNSLISVHSSIHKKNFVPFFNECFGLLQIVKYSPSDSSDINFNLDKSFTNYYPIFKYDSFHSQIKFFNDLLSRLSLPHVQTFRRKPLSSLVDLDEISPVEDDNPRIPDDLIINQIERPLLDKSRCNPIILEPLSLEIVQKKRVMNRVYETEQKKLVRITIMYTLAFFALAITTFFIIYLA